MQNGEPLNLFACFHAYSFLGPPSPFYATNSMLWRRRCAVRREAPCLKTALTRVERTNLYVCTYAYANIMPPISHLMLGAEPSTLLLSSQSSSRRRREEFWLFTVLKEKVPSRLLKGAWRYFSPITEQSSPTLFYVTHSEIISEA